MTDNAIPAFDQGRIEGRLDEHERRLNVINGSQERTAQALQVIQLTIQRLADQADARDDKVIATATALKDAAESRWAPWTRVAVVLGGFCVLVSLILSVYLAFRHNTITQLPTKGSH